MSYREIMRRAEPMKAGWLFAFLREADVRCLAKHGHIFLDGLRDKPRCVESVVAFLRQQAGCDSVIQRAGDRKVMAKAPPRGLIFSDKPRAMPPELCICGRPL